MIVVSISAFDQTRAKELFRNYADKLRGRREEAIIGSCILIACRMENSTRSLKGAA